ncbi:uncharacterized protein L3040_001723 [Drepanopeziza brunnea f. sp. 'multigermtubi']|uniref:2-haloalkanoic acid dehalogenase n=1 Tax=Marssonina brunnea f. sp. multigermtubi (strain MB_m1) TaxID=1072389 RepID=K1WQQ7_MARBU|nr:uncharacterized protein MBM_06572 [Drepanopeziza brunnea f. sp. 'multigermtubi' MB_m1]EKD15356.1 hypothetical protein MBM_06572 [Drepanopeziza brunnea f. sp. 'multigermtubi' MB_m1]KAJ5051962.1 hypothetical protein L3040_001723 [Drepanopeziza brunnea f. sp. 'multigermtubi']
MAPKKHLVLDVVGTCVSFTAFYAQIARTLGPRLLAHNISPAHFGYTWKEAAELEFYLLLQSERGLPYPRVLAAVFARTLVMAGVPAGPVRAGAFASREERDVCVRAYTDGLELRDGCREMVERLRGEGWLVWCLTSGEKGRVKGYFEKGGLVMEEERIVSCAELGERMGTGQGALYKPCLAAYRAVLGLFAEEDEKWFGAAHMWDVSAAVKAGFRGAYCSIYDQDPCAEIFDTETMDVMAETLPEMADKMIALTSP